MSEMILWGGIFLVSLVILIVALYFMVRKVMKLGFIQKLGRGKKKQSVAIAAAFIALIVIVGAIFTTVLNSFIILLHLMVFWLIGDLVALIFKKKTNVTFYIACGLTAVYLSIAAYLCFTVVEKDYKLSTNKDVGSIRVVQIADSHLGTTFDGEGLNKYVDMINEVHPDVVLITGDFVDDATGRDDMVAGCEALSHLETKYGVYYSFGNHDKGYGEASSRGYTGDDLIAELQKNGVVVLQDEAVLIDERFYIVGRQDKSEESRGNERANMKDLLSDLDTSKYIIVMDHQPNDYKAQAESSADLVLSGHTHGGQLIPINDVGILIGANDATYGLETRNDTNFIVTSGISDWEILFKTGCRSEFVVVDING